MDSLRIECGSLIICEYAPWERGQLLEYYEIEESGQAIVIFAPNIEINRSVFSSAIRALGPLQETQCKLH